jgi:hypothetical protein
MLGKTAAYVTCKWKQTQENEGKLEDASGRMTLIFRLIGRDWKVVHRHTSPDNPGADAARVSHLSDKTALNKDAKKPSFCQEGRLSSNV